MCDLRYAGFSAIADDEGRFVKTKTIPNVKAGEKLPWTKVTSITFVMAAFAFAMAPLLLSGCQYVRAGQRISQNMAAFIQPGGTTRTEIVAEFGPPSIELKDERVIAYTWQTENATRSSPAWRGGVMERDETIIGLADWAFCIRLDERDRVLNTATLEITENQPSLYDAVSSWAKTRQ